MSKSFVLVVGEEVAEVMKSCCSGLRFVEIQGLADNEKGDDAQEKGLDTPAQVFTNEVTASMQQSAAYGGAIAELAAERKKVYDELNNAEKPHE